MVFRPLPVLSLFTLPLLAALIWLGLWQLQRAEWKVGLIEAYERAASAPASTAETVLCGEPPASGLSVSPPSVEPRALRIFGHDLQGAAGWRLFSPAYVCGSERPPVLVEAGFEPLPLGGEIASQAPVPTSLPDRFLTDLWPSKPLMAAVNASDRNEWYWFDPAPMADALDVAELRTDIVLLAASQMPDFLTRTPPVRHIGYAVTWFGMAIALLAFYLVFHLRAGRLRLTRDGNSSS